MGNELQIDINPDGDRFGLTLRAKILRTPNAGQSFKRDAWELDEMKLEMLRLGSAPEDLVRDVTTAVSRWLLDPDLNGLLATALNLTRGGEPLRVIFSVSDPEIRSRLNGLPLELVTLRDTADALVLSTDVASLVHQLPNANKSTAGQLSDRWPLKILVVRTNPNELGGAIPPASEIRDSILNIWNEDPALDPTLLRVDVLSHAAEEPPGMKLAGPPTVDAFERQLLKVSYDILIYVGHGDVGPSAPGSVGGGFLQFENEHRTGPAAYRAGDLAAALSSRPVPVVLLMGCLTAVDQLPEEKREVVPKALPNWILGNQGVAQALIDSASGVLFALGMQYQISTVGAKRFLEFFFLSLLKNEKVALRGNVEEAVRVARGSLRHPQYSYLWSAPVIFSALCPEPLLPFLQSLPACEPFDDTMQTTRGNMWGVLGNTTWRSREVNPEIQGTVAGIHGVLQFLDRQMVEATEKSKASLLMPGFAEARAGEEVRVPVALHGGLKGVRTIEGKLKGAGGLKVRGLELSAELEARDFRAALTNPETGEFLLRHRGEGDDLAAGELFKYVLVSDQAAAPYANVRFYDLEVEPPQPLCPGDNAVVFPRP